MSSADFDLNRAKRRREQLQLRLKRQGWSETFRKVAPSLCGAGVKFAKLPPARASEFLQHVSHAPGRDDWVYWPEIQDAHCSPWSDLQQCCTLIQAALDACGAGHDRIGIVFHTATAGLLLNAATVPQAWPLIHEHIHETVWLVPTSPNPWLVEVSFVDREVCFTPSLTNRLI